MAYTTPTYYGYKITNNLSDITNKNLAIQRLTLNIGDLNIIRGAASSDGAVREDLIAISDLDTPLYQALDRYIGDSSQHKPILDASAGVDSTLRGNLQVNGPIGGSAIRYRFLDYTLRLSGTVSGTFRLNEKVTGNSSTAIGYISEVGAGFVIVKNIIGNYTTGETVTGSYSAATISTLAVTNTTDLKFADISTSRVSAWSTATGTPQEADPIFYGGQVQIANGGSVSVDKITWGQVAQPKLFGSEVPTHTITTNINGVAVKLYAMKSIPLKFRGFFKRFDGTVYFSQTAGTFVSWRIVNANNSADIQSYANIGSSSGSGLSYRSLTSAERDIEIYYNPDNVNQIYLPSVGMSQLPAAALPNLTNLYIPYNEIKDVPNVATFAPNLTTLHIFGNNFYLASDVALRKFTKTFVNNLPVSLRTLSMQGNFYGTIRAVDRTSNVGNGGTIVGSEITSGIGGANSMSVVEARFPNLETFDIGRGINAYYGPDDYDTNAFLPTVSNTCINYYVYHNDFRSVPVTGLKDRTNLQVVHLYGNYYLTDNTFSLSSNNLTYVNIGATHLPIPDLKLKPSLSTFDGNYTWNAGLTENSMFTSTDGSDASYKFSGCSNLQTLTLYASAVRGFIPKFSGNTKLSWMDMYAAQGITGGRKDKTGYVLYKDTFDDCRSTLGLFRVLSYSLEVGKGFEPKTFNGMSSLWYLFWYSYGRTGAGTTTVQLPDISQCPSLVYLVMPANSFTGPVPNMASNANIHYIDLADQRLEGEVPTFENRTNLAYVFLHNNQLTSFPGFKATPNMYFVYMYNNQLTGKIPMLGATDRAPAINRLFLFNNQFNDYTKTSFAGLTRLYNLDISNNNLFAQHLNDIITDLYTNYLAAPRSGVNINLRSQTNAVGYNPSPLGTDVEKVVYEKLEFLRSKGWTITIG